MTVGSSTTAIFDDLYGYYQVNYFFVNVRDDARNIIMAIHCALSARN